MYKLSFILDVFARILIGWDKSMQIPSSTKTTIHEPANLRYRSRNSFPKPFVRTFFENEPQKSYDETNTADKIDAKMTEDLIFCGNHKNEVSLHKHAEELTALQEFKVEKSNSGELSEDEEITRELFTILGNSDPFSDSNSNSFSAHQKTDKNPTLSTNYQKNLSNHSQSDEKASDFVNEEICGPKSMCDKNFDKKSELLEKSCLRFEEVKERSVEGDTRGMGLGEGDRRRGAGDRRRDRRGEGGVTQHTQRLSHLLTDNISKGNLLSCFKFFK